MPAINAALQKWSLFYPVYIFDEDELKEKRTGYNRIRFILEALKDIDEKLRKHGGRLYVFAGRPVDILSALIKKWFVFGLSYEEDTQPGWRDTERSIAQVCQEGGVEVVKRVSHTLWDLGEVLRANNGQPPATFEVFSQVVEVLGAPLRPDPALSLESVTLTCEEDPGSMLPCHPEEMGCEMECPQQKNKIWIGGETRAFQHLEDRLKVEEKALREGLVMPNQVETNLLGPPMSMSASLSRGCLSIRNFYWCLLDMYESVDSDFYLPDSLIGQLMWREYFYAMCMNNPSYATMTDNPICLTIPWTTDEKLVKCWTEGLTGFPFIDAAMRQLHQEGWMHHVARNAVACFLTRGDLWISWEEGFNVFMKYLLDADVPVCAGNWMWVSSSAFENILQCASCVSPITYGKHFEPTGDYIRKFVPELRKMPTQFVYEPWTAPLDVQQKAGCVIGEDYPLPVVCHQEAAERNSAHMEDLRRTFLGETPLCTVPRAALWRPWSLWGCLKGVQIMLWIIGNRQLLYSLHLGISFFKFLSPLYSEEHL